MGAGIKNGERPATLRRLRAAYGRLPRRTEERIRIARTLVDIAASAIGELASQVSEPKQMTRMAVADRGQVDGDLQLMLQSALFVANDALPGPHSSGNGRKPAGLVIDMISRNPGMPFTAAKVASAVNMTPTTFPPCSTATPAGSSPSSSSSSASSWPGNCCAT